MGYTKPSSPFETSDFVVKDNTFAGGALTVDNRVLQDGVTRIAAEVVVNAPAYGGVPAEQAVFLRHAIVTQAAGVPSISADPFTEDHDNATNAVRATGAITVPAAALLADGDTIHVGDPNSTTDYKVDKTGLFFDDASTLIEISGKAKGSISCPASSGLVNGNGFTISDGIAPVEFQYDVDGLGLIDIMSGGFKGFILLSGKSQGIVSFPAVTGISDGELLAISDGVHVPSVFEFRASVVGLKPGRVWVDTSGIATAGELSIRFKAAADALTTAVFNITTLLNANGYAFFRNNAVGAAGNVPITATLTGFSVIFNMGYGVASAYSTAAQVAAQTAAFVNALGPVLGLAATATVYGTTKAGFTNNAVGVAGNVAISAVTGVTLLRGMDGGEAAATTLASGIAAKLDAAINADATIDIASTPTGAALALLADATGYAADVPITTTNPAITVSGMSLGSLKMAATFAVDGDNLVGVALANLPPAPLTIVTRRVSVVAPSV